MANKPHWHDANPWRDRIVYITLDEAIDATEGLDQPISTPDGIVLLSRDMLRLHYTRAGPHNHFKARDVDCYLLPGPGHISLGIRYGARGEEYLSPLANQSVARDVLRKYERMEP